MRWVRREAAHHRDRLLDVRVAVAVHERQPEHAHVETFHREEEALGSELALGVPVDRRAGIVLADQAAAIRTVDQARAREDEALHAGSAGGAREVLRAEIVDGVGLLGGRAAEEGRAVDHGVDAAHRGCERIRLEQIAPGELDASFAQPFGARFVAHEGSHLVAALGKSFRESASDLSGRSGDENLHARNVVIHVPRRLEKTDKRATKVARPRACTQNRPMHAGALHHDNRIAPSARAASAVAALIVHDCDRDGPGVLIPRPEVHLVVRFGPSARSGLDAHAFGGRQRVHRKVLRSGQRTVTVRLHLGAHEAVLGVPATAITGGIVALEDLWGGPSTRRLFDRLAEARTTAAAAAILEGAIAERVATADGQSARGQFAIAAADRLTRASVNAVADDLGVSERHLRRVFRETVGVSPKTFARLARFRRAVRAAREEDHAGWASIAAEAGYYDQAHLIAEFRVIAGATPQGLLGELRAAPPIG